MVDRKDEIIEKLTGLTDTLRRSGFRVVRVFLYGSSAKGNRNVASDIDVAFISPDFHPDSMDEWTRLLRLCQEADVRIEPVFYRPEDFRDEEPLAWEIKSTGHEIALTPAA
jgi:predicted nucleotidyltransferase